MSAPMSAHMAARATTTTHIWCQRHRCRISVTGCTLRLRRAEQGFLYIAYGRTKLGHTPYDPQCYQCPQGLRVQRGDLDDMETDTNPTKRSVGATATEIRVAAPSAPLDEATKICRMCRTDLPISAFNHDASCADGRSRFCRDCRKKQQRGERARRKQRYADGQRLDRTQSAAPNGDTPPAPNETYERRRITIDFIGREGLIRHIESVATEEFRTVEQQILYWLAHQLAYREEQRP